MADEVDESASFPPLQLCEMYCSNVDVRIPDGVVLRENMRVRGTGDGQRERAGRSEISVPKGGLYLTGGWFVGWTNCIGADRALSQGFEERILLIASWCSLTMCIGLRRQQCVLL